MSERMAAQIWIGGKVPAQLVPELCGEIDAEGVALDWGGARFAPKTEAELLKARVDYDGAAVLYLCDEQASWGRFDSLEGLLQEHGIPFTRESVLYYTILLFICTLLRHSWSTSFPPPDRMGSRWSVESFCTLRSESLSSGSRRLPEKER